MVAILYRPQCVNVLIIEAYMHASRGRRSLFTLWNQVAIQYHQSIYACTCSHNMWINMSILYQVKFSK